MFAMSVKSVPGWWVLIEPKLIGVPAAFTPGLGPHDDVSVAPPAAALLLAAVVLAAVLVAALLVAAVLVGALLLELLLLLLPHPAIPIAPTNATTAKLGR